MQIFRIFYFEAIVKPLESISLAKRVLENSHQMSKILVAHKDCGQDCIFCGGRKCQMGCHNVYGASRSEEGPDGGVQKRRAIYLAASI
jgi:hypothetical protein